ncbi:Homogentisate phytyltransferase 2 [Sarracenia purpurea var. burkii]
MQHRSVTSVVYLPMIAPRLCRTDFVPLLFQISTLATELGVRNIAFLGSGILLLNYIGAILAAVLMPQVFRRSLMIPAHAILALSLIFQSWLLEKANYTQVSPIFGSMNDCNSFST